MSVEERTHRSFRCEACRATMTSAPSSTVWLDCHVLRAHGSDVRIVVYTPRPGSPDAEALALIGVIGLQSMTVKSASQ